MMALSVYVRVTLYPKKISPSFTSVMSFRFNGWPIMLSPPTSNGSAQISPGSLLCLTFPAVSSWVMRRTAPQERLSPGCKRGNSCCKP
jgi:hypothetical protein